MCSSVLRNLYIISEGKSDAQIIRTILDCKDFNKVYCYSANSFNNIPSICKTLRLMIDINDKILIVFDADSCDPDTIDNKISMLEFLTNSTVSRVNIGLFCMVPYLEVQLKLPKLKGKDKITEEFLSVFKDQIDSIRKLPIITNMQSFLCGNKSYSYYCIESCQDKNDAS